MPSKRAALAGGDFVARVAGESGIVHLFDGGVLLQELGNAQGVGGLRADAPGQGIDAAQGEPAIEGRGHAAAVAL